MNDLVIHCVMFAMTLQAGAITHAQVVGGFPDLDACENRILAAEAIINQSLTEEGERAHAFCVGANKELVAPKGGAVL
jgi:hypothetical protein